MDSLMLIAATRDREIWMRVARERDGTLQFKFARKVSKGSTAQFRLSYRGGGGGYGHVTRGGELKACNQFFLFSGGTESVQSVQKMN